MKRIFLLVCVLLFIQLGRAVSQTIACESIEYENWSGSIGNIRTCYMRSTTTIDTDAVSVSPPDSSVLGMSFNENKKISFLPIKLDETYPNIVGYDAGRCSLKTVSKINFKNLQQLKQLYLSDNQIETIKSDTFEDLTLLEWLFLGSNKIKKINGAAFGNLNKLTIVNLYGNICINIVYGGAYSDFYSLVKDVKEKCAFAEPDANEGSTVKTLAHWNLILMIIFMRLLG